jgi:tetratricopeptide (TPR) repeat protein
MAQQRFDMKVREDFFAGAAGNKEALERAMKVTAETLARDPKHAEAKVWHGTGLLIGSNEAFQKGDVPNGLELWRQALEEMEQAVLLAPDNIAVLIPRGASLITATRFTPGDFGAAALKTAVGDFEKVLALQEPVFSKLSVHSRGELLTGLADGWSRLGDPDKARQYFTRISEELKGTVYDKKANAWLMNQPEAKSPAFFNCSGCHVPQ